MSNHNIDEITVTANNPTEEDYDSNINTQDNDIDNDNLDTQDEYSQTQIIPNSNFYDIEDSDNIDDTRLTYHTEQNVNVTNSTDNLAENNQAKTNIPSADNHLYVNKIHEQKPFLSLENKREISEEDFYKDLVGKDDWYTDIDLLKINDNIIFAILVHSQRLIKDNNIWDINIPADYAFMIESIGKDKLIKFITNSFFEKKGLKISVNINILNIVVDSPSSKAKRLYNTMLKNTKENLFSEPLINDLLNKLSANKENTEVLIFKNT